MDEKVVEFEEREAWFLDKVYKVMFESGLAIEELDLMKEKFFMQELDTITTDTLTDWKASMDERLEVTRLSRHGFEERLGGRWCQPFKLLEMMILISLESAEKFHRDYSTIVNSKKDFVFVALIQIQARACQCASEALCLLRGGYAEGAFTHWRTIHELDVIASFIQKHGADVAERYLEYKSIEKYDEMKEYQKQCEALDFAPITEEVKKEITNLREQAIRKYGKEFKELLGWTANVWQEKKKNFKKLEEYVEMSHLRPYYKWACNYVHAGSRGLSSKIGLLKEQQNLLVACGSSNYGLADPGQNICLSLNRITSYLLTYSPNVEQIVTVKALNMLCKEACSAFVTVQEQIEKEEEEEMARPSI